MSPNVRRQMRLQRHDLPRRAQRERGEASPLAAGVSAPSTLIVAINAQLLRGAPL